MEQRALTKNQRGDENPIIVDIPGSRAATMQPRPRKSRSPVYFVLVGCLCAFTLLVVFWENDTESNARISTTEHSSKHRPGDTSGSTRGVERGAGSFLFWGKTQDDNLGKQTKQKTFSDKTRKKTKKKQKTKKEDALIPVIDDPDDELPMAALPAGTLVKAADALMCSATVIDYVINATDLKDECDGLKRAFDAHCTNGFNSEESMQATGRRLSSEGAMRNRRSNPIDDIRHFLHDTRKQMKRYFRHKEDIFMAEEAVLAEWQNSQYEVEQNWDEVEVLYTGHPSLRRSLRSENTSDASKAVNTTTIVAANKTSTGHTTPKVSLKLPTAVKHVSGKTLDETLSLQSGELAGPAPDTSKTDNGKNTDLKTSKNTVAQPPGILKGNVESMDYDEARACCASVLNVFHENCNFDNEEELSDARLFIVIAVIAMCGLVKSVIRYFNVRWLPEAAGCILVGVLAGWLLTFYPHHDMSFEENYFLRILVPPIVFEAALSIDKASFNRHVVPILLYAILGTLMATGITAWIVHNGSIYFSQFCQPIPIIDALTFGALISSIDPIAVLSVLSNMGMTDTDTIYVLIFGESLLNDGVAICLFQTLVHFLDDNLKADAHAVLAASIHFLVVFVGSLLVGVASGLTSTFYFWVMHGCQTPLVEVLLFCCWALIPYYVCDGIEWSGIVAVVATGFVMDYNIVGQHHVNETSDQSDPGMKARRRPRRRPLFSPTGHLSKEAKTHIHFVTEIIATTMETAIFAYLGLFLFSSRYHWNNYHVFVAIAACCGSRAIMIPMMSVLANWTTEFRRVVHTSPQPQRSMIIDKKMQLVLWFAGLRGAMSFALVEHIPLYDAATGEGSRFKAELKAMTSASIMFSVFILGGSTYYVMEMLGMAPHEDDAGKSQRSKEPTEMELASLLPRPNENGENGLLGGTESQHSSLSYIPDDDKTTTLSPMTTFRQRVQLRAV